MLIDTLIARALHRLDATLVTQKCRTVDIRPATTVWTSGTTPLPPKPWLGHGIGSKRLRREPGNEPVEVKAFALALPKNAWSMVA